jgi:molecular chaperone GrpE (heat shock protein)
MPDLNPMATNGLARGKLPAGGAAALTRGTPAPVVTPTPGNDLHAANGENVQQFAKGLIKRIDLLDDLIANVADRDASAAAQLGPLRASFEDLLREHSVEPFTVEVGKPIDVATRKKITIVEATKDQDGATEIAEVFRPGYLWQNGGGGAPMVLRKAEVRTRKPGAPVA